MSYCGLLKYCNEREEILPVSHTTIAASISTHPCTKHAKTGTSIKRLEVLVNVHCNSMNSSSFKTHKSVKLFLNRFVAYMHDKPHYTESKFYYPKYELTAKFEFFTLSNSSDKNV